MRLLSIDIETTGLDLGKDDVTEIGYVVFDTEIEKPFKCVSHMIDLGGIEVPEVITELTGITNSMLSEFGVPASMALDSLVGDMVVVDYLVAHNGNFFDKPFLTRWAKERGYDLPEKPWLDTYEDIKYPKHFRYRNLTYLAAEHGFLNPFPHAALFDAMTVSKLVRHYNIDDIIERFKTPWVVARAMVDYDRREEAKSRGYSWENVGGKKYSKCWVKRLKENELEIERDNVPFKVAVIEE